MFPFVRVNLEDPEVSLDDKGEKRNEDMVTPHTGLDHLLEIHVCCFVITAEKFFIEKFI